MRRCRAGARGYAVHDEAIPEEMQEQFGLDDFVDATPREALSVAGKKVKNARVTIKHNGVVIHNDVELPGPTPGGKGGAESEPGPVFLQDHGNPVRYRNVWVVGGEHPGPPLQTDLDQS